MGAPPYPLAIAAIFRNEAPYLKEWIEFHLAVGCTHFYLFNNLSSDDYLEVLKPYLQRGVVELFAWPLEHDQQADWGLNQCLAYEKALYLAQGKAKWLALIDTDEFLFSEREEDLSSLLSRYEDFGGVTANWQIFGTSSVPQIPKDQLLIETLEYKLPKDAPANHMVKSIVRPECVQGCDSSHFVIYKPGYFQVNTDRLRFEGKCSPYVQIDTLRINHYQVRDEYFLKTQKIPRVRKWWNAQSEEAWQTFYQSYNQVQDRSIFRFLPRLRVSAMSTGPQPNENHQK